MRDRFLTQAFKPAVIALFAMMVCGGVSLADQIVDPSKVAPEFRDAAEKRRAEQMRILDCNNAAKMANILPRDSVKFVADCFDKASNKPSDISATRK